MINLTKRSKTHHQNGQMEKYFLKMSSMEEVLSNKSTDDESAIYIHVPFCKKICSFCNLRRFKGLCSDNYHKLLLENLEIIGKSRFGQSLKIGSVYFGGGTPTVMNVDFQREVLDKIFEIFDVKKDAEISTETSLTDLDKEKLKALKKSGLNRISVGVQTFDDDGRKLLGRIGNGTFARKRLEEYLDTGLFNVNIDLIYNYPYQTKEILKKDMEIIGKMNLSGFSLYSLIINKGSQLEKILAAQKTMNEEDKLKKDLSYYNIVVEQAEKYGYEFLEITKMVRPNRDEYKYIKISNSQKNIIPIGAGAGGMINNSPIMNPLTIQEYKESLKNLEKRKIPVLNELYRKEKIALKKIQFGYFDLKDLDFIKLDSKKRIKIEKYMDELIKNKLAEQNKSVYTLTKTGRFWANTITGQIMEIL